MAGLKGAAVLEVENALGANNVMTVTTDTTQNPTTDRSVFEIDADGTLTLRFYESNPTAGSSPDNLIVRVYAAATNQQIIELHNGAPPASGTSWTLHGTLNGQAGGTPCMGPLEIYIHGQTTGGLSPWEADTRGVEDMPLLWDVNRADPGILRGNDPSIPITHLSGYPAGSIHALNPGAGDETASARATFARPYDQDPEYDVKLDILDGNDVQIAGVWGTAQTSGVVDTAAVVNETNFDSASKTYGARLSVRGDSLLEPTSGPMQWTRLIASGGQTQVSDAIIEDADVFDADPRLTAGTPTLNFDTINVGEQGTIAIGVTNARGESLTRSLDLTLRDSGGTSKATASDTGATYNLNYTTQTGDDADDTLAGKQWTLDIDHSQQTTTLEVDVFSVSTYNQVHSGATLPTPGDPTSADGSVTVTRAGASSNSILNHGQSVTVTGSKWGVRGQAWPFSSGNSIAVINEAGSSEVSSSLTVAGDGTFSHVYTPPLAGGHAPGALTPGGTPDTNAKHFRFTPANGNAVRDTPDVVTLHNGLTVVELWAGKSEADADANGEPDADAAASFFVGADVMYAKPQVNDAAGDPYDDGAITLNTLRNAIVEDTQTGAVTQTESGFLGWADLFNSFQVVAPAGDRTLRGDIVRGGNAVREEITVTYAPSYTGNLALIPVGRPVASAPGTARVDIVLRIYEQSGGQNVARLLSEVTPTPTLDDQPRYIVWEHDGASAPVAVAPGTLQPATQTGGNNDMWRLNFTQKAGKNYTIEAVATINGGQVHDRIYIGQPPAASNAAQIDKLQFLDSGHLGQN